MKNLYLLAPTLLLLSSCSLFDTYTQDNRENIVINQPSFTCNTELPSDEEIDVYNFYPDNDNEKARKKCSQERTSCPDEYFEYLYNFLRYKLTIEPNYRSSGIMKSLKIQQNKICIKIYERKYRSKNKK